MRFEVWAPAARSVDLVLGDARVAMSPAGDRGWWSAEAEATAGNRYAYSIDGGEPRPDPRSMNQPDGVHGDSAVVDHGAFDWTDDGWRAGPLRSAVIYELHVGTFTAAGTFDAAMERLDHIVGLGATAVELMPLAEAPGARGWGYDGVDLYAPHDAYGGPEALKRLIDACHRKGLAAILDVVYNHLGPDGNYLAEFGPYFTDRYDIPWGAAPNLDGAHSDEVRRFFLDNALMWLRDYHFDGLRLDAVHAIFDSSAVHFLEQLADEVDSLAHDLGRDLWVIAESDLNDPRLVRRRDEGGFDLDAQWSDDFHHALHSVLTGESAGHYADFGTIEQLAYSLRHAYVFDGRYSRVRKRSHGRSADGVPGYRFLGYSQNHDQIGNRARGERSSALMSTGLLKVAAALVLTSPFVPMLFQGEEWGATSPFLYFTDHQDPELARAVSEGRARDFAAFGWPAEGVPDPQAEGTFAASKLDWSELEDSRHADLLEWHRRLIAFRRGVPELVELPLEATSVRFDASERWLVVERGPVTLACNLGAAPMEFPEAVVSGGRLELTSGKEPEGGPSGPVVAPESVAIYRR